MAKSSSSTNTATDKMVSRQFLSMLSTTTLVTGALLVGDAIHGSIVVGSYGITSPAAVLRVLPGIILVYVGYSLRENHELFISSYFSGREAAAKPEGSEEFDERMSPLSGESMDNLEKRERERNKSE
ncbi:MULTISPECIES: hypothetical protein [unclassified Haladaptatus]|uniref:hypothetical protein n=1 Tax=unclassified Haladaptatus TaxID=2622732 RepID=UPI00209C05FA|nr:MULTISPECIES: hypothetical protein [unclassified Haladaptatus]MCO8246989.1 hypothetical protein [Haladaptatus sp. AB643]MCO8254628.1 hypothetical protein [Haladaptatus sp. AB618]